MFEPFGQVVPVVSMERRGQDGGEALKEQELNLRAGACIFTLACTM